MESPMPVLRVSSRLSGGVLFQPLSSARQQILFHNPPSLKSSKIVIHDTTILERMQEVSSRIPENGKCGIWRAGADKNTWPFLFSKKWYHIPTSAAGTSTRRPIGTFIWNMKAMLRTAPIWKMCFKCYRHRRKTGNRPRLHGSGITEWRKRRSSMANRHP